MFDFINIVLVEPSHPGNVGATARAMKTMGFSRLVLVNPKSFPHPQAIALSAGAEDILENAVVVQTLEEAIAESVLVVGTSARFRSLSWPLKTVRHWVEEISVAPLQGPLSILFGAERIGLTNEQLHQCHSHIWIPTNPEYSSLNLASAVQLICYELRQGLMNQEKEKISLCVPTVPKATAQELEGFFKHLETILYHTHFLDPAQPKQLIGRLRRLFFRADLDIQEVNILRGILSAVGKMTFSSSSP